jgi:hypothetical protein
MKELNKKTVNKPELPVKILQFGEGNFLRAFVDWMLHKANEAGVMNHCNFSTHKHKKSFLFLKILLYLCARNINLEFGNGKRNCRNRYCAVQGLRIVRCGLSHRRFGARQRVQLQGLLFCPNGET